MARYNISIELSDYGVFKALQWDDGLQVSSSNYMDVKQALFEALKKEVDVEDLEEQLELDFEETD
jgi:hypothetical protein|tara:strand:+ start:269 stop:463 length:195 start_codon:yes stop_codon:yes gene_type:complete